MFVVSKYSIQFKEKEVKKKKMMGGGGWRRIL
jgi:hypothetical protein